MINKKLFELIDYLNSKKIINSEEIDDEEDKKVKKVKEEKINLKIDLLEEFISVIKTKYYFEDKKENIKTLEKQINENYNKIKNSSKYFFIFIYI